MLFSTLITSTLLLLGIEVSYAQTAISPTMSDANNEYYASNTSNEFELGYILCSADKDNCHIKCDAESTCSEITINATLTQHLFLECNGDLSCEGITVYGPDNSVSIECAAYRSCQYSTFEFHDTKTVNMNCDGTDQYSTTYACNGITVNAAMAQDINIECIRGNSCQNAVFNGTSVNNSIN
eukprot:279939_1